MALKIIELLIRLAILVMAGIVIPAFKRWLDEKTESEKLMKVRAWVYAAVEAAEQMRRTVWKLDPGGVERKKFVRNTVNKICLQSGIAISEKDLDVLIEAAVNTINSINATDHKEDGEGSGTDGDEEDS